MLFMVLAWIFFPKNAALSLRKMEDVKDTGGRVTVSSDNSIFPNWK
jgi:hypothetical protein